MANVNFKGPPAFNCNIDLWSEGDRSYGTFFTPLILDDCCLIQCINEVLADMANTHSVFLIAPSAVIAVISLPLSIWALCDVIRPPSPAIARTFSAPNVSN